MAYLRHDHEHNHYYFSFRVFRPIPLVMIMVTEVVMRGDGHHVVAISACDKPRASPVIAATSTRPFSLTANGVGNDDGNGCLGIVQVVVVYHLDQHHYHHPGYSDYHTVPSGSGNGTGLAFVVKIVVVAVAYGYNHY
jgi:hypothetical protein